MGLGNEATIRLEAWSYRQSKKGTDVLTGISPIPCCSQMLNVFQTATMYFNEADFS